MHICCHIQDIVQYQLVTVTGKREIYKVNANVKYIYTFKFTMMFKIMNIIVKDEKVGNEKISMMLVRELLM